jgi:tRNA pseudouridine55 synthase
MGRELACGAHLESLRRTSVAEFTLEDAHTLEELAEAAGKNSSGKFEPHQIDFSSHRGHGPGGTSDNSPPVPLAGKPDHREPRPGGTPETLEALFIHPRKLLPHLPSVTADEPTVARIRTGRTVNLPDVSRARQVKVFAGQRDLIAIATRVAGTLFHPKLVLCT